MAKAMAPQFHKEVGRSFEIKIFKNLLDFLQQLFLSTFKKHAMGGME
jgi:hypothetical protein